MKRITNLTEYLDNTAAKYADKPAFIDTDKTMTFSMLRTAALKIASALNASGYRREAVAVLMNRGADMIAAFFGVLYAKCFYVPMDPELSKHRVRGILASVQPRAIICCEATRGFTEELSTDSDILLYDALTDSEPADIPVPDSGGIDTDLAYIVYTSGSTGAPKGIAASHRNVIDYIEDLSHILRVSEGTIFGSQTPLYVDACLKEVYTTVRSGATTVIIPKALFTTPVKLIEFLNAHKINSVCWVVSALTMISGFGTLSRLKPEFLELVAFGSEVFPPAQFALWREALPEARFINLYGPTETTGMCCYYEITDLPQGAIPIGRAFPNTDVFILGPDGKAVTEPGAEGEIYIRGSRVASGYYRDKERSAAAFVQNPLQNDYREIVYRTGDIAKYNEDGDIVYISRRDHQIKHMGYRIELSEIEAFASAQPGVAQTCAIYDREKDRIILYYSGFADEAGLYAAFKNEMPKYMMPARVRHIEEIPLTVNGKIDRIQLEGIK